MAPLLQALKPHTGHPNLDHCHVLNGMLWIKRTGAPWPDLPERYGKWTTVSSRFYRWQQARIWHRILDNLQAQANSYSQMDWEIHYVDGTIVRAHQHADGARASQAGAEALDRSQDSFRSRELSALTAGQRRETIAFEQLMSQLTVQ